MKKRFILVWTDKNGETRWTLFIGNPWTREMAETAISDNALLFKAWFPETAENTAKLDWLYHARRAF